MKNAVFMVSLLWTETRQLVEIRQYNTNWQLGQSQKSSSIAPYCTFVLSVHKKEPLRNDRLELTAKQAKD